MCVALGFVQLRRKARLSRSRSRAELGDGDDAVVRPRGCQKRDGSRARSRLEAVLLFDCYTSVVASDPALRKRRRRR